MRSFAPRSFAILMERRMRSRLPASSLKRSARRSEGEGVNGERTVKVERVLVE